MIVVVMDWNEIEFDEVDDNLLHLSTIVARTMAIDVQLQVIMVTSFELVLL
jgi:hypothetical protein